MTEILIFRCKFELYIDNKEFTVSEITKGTIRIVKTFSKYLTVFS